MNDPFRNQVPGLESPAARLASDTADLAFPIRARRILSAGTPATDIVVLA